MTAIRSTLVVISLFIGSLSYGYSDSISQIQREYEFLKEQTTAFKQEVRSQQNDYQDYVQSTLELGVYIISGALAVVLAFFGWVGYRTFREIREKVAERAIQEADAMLKRQFDEKIGGDLHQLQRQIHLLRRFEHSRMLFVGHDKQVEDWKAFEVKILLGAGLKEIFCTTDVTRSVVGIDLLVYSYPPVVEEGLPDSNLAGIIERAKERAFPLPVIIYAPGRIHPTDLQLLRAYQWYSLANMPLTLLSHIRNSAEFFYSYSKPETL